MHFAKNCQKSDYGSRNIYFLNVEGRLKRRDIEGIPGINPKKLFVIESTEDKILSSEDYLNIAEKILTTDKRCVLIIDSISQLCDERTQTGGVGVQTRGSGAIWVSQFTSQMGPVVQVKNSIVICILQLRANTSGYGATSMEKGGNAIQYQVDIKLRVKEVEPWAVTKGAEPFGQIVTWSCESSALGPPGRKCDSYIRYGQGIDEIMESILDARDIGLISGSTWLYLDFLEKYPEVTGIAEWNEAAAKEIGAYAQGMDKMYALLMERTEWLDLLKKELLETL
jgi:RecA/RadA recombinase